MITVEIMGKSYQIKCKESEADSLRQAAQCVEERIRTIREAGNIANNERLAVLTALNLAYQLLNAEDIANIENRAVQVRLRNLQHTVDTALIQHSKELNSAE